MIPLLAALGASALVLSVLLVALFRTNIFSWSTLQGERAPFRLTLPTLRVLILIALLGVWTALAGVFPRAVPWGWEWSILTLGGASAVLLVLLSWVLTRERAERVVQDALPFFSLLDRLLGPVFPRKEDEREEARPEDEPTENELKTYIDMGMEEGIFEGGEEARMMESVLDFSDTLVREVMMPRTDMVTVASDAPFDAVMDAFVRSHYSRLPVTGRSLDDITGIVHLKDFVRVMKTEPLPSAASLLRPAVLVPETKRVRDLLREMREGRQGMAIVVDEYGGTAGLVTLEDLLEEIVGEIEDEEGIPPIVEVARGKWSVAGKVHIEELSEALELELENPEVDTVAGFLIAQLGRIPKTGDTVQAMGAEFTVETADPRRIYRVLVRKAGAP